LTPAAEAGSVLSSYPSLQAHVNDPNLPGPVDFNLRMQQNQFYVRVRYQSRAPEHISYHFPRIKLYFPPRTKQAPRER
jgi:hypothetical protein